MKKKFRAMITLAATALLVPALIVNASSAAAASKAPTAAVKSSFSQQSFQPLANTFIQKVIQSFAQEVQKVVESVQNGKGNNGKGNSGNSGNNGNGNGNSGNNGNGNGNSGNNGNGNGNSGNNGNGNGNSGNNGNGNGNSGNNGNGNGNSGNNEKKIQQVYNDTSAKLFQLRNQCQAGLTDIAVEFTTLTSTHEKTELYKTGTAAFNSCTSQYQSIMDDAAAQIVALGGEPSILEPMQTRYEEEIVAGREQLNAIVNK